MTQKNKHAQVNADVMGNNKFKKKQTIIHIDGGDKDRYDFLVTITRAEARIVHLGSPKVVISYDSKDSMWEICNACYDNDKQAQHNLKAIQKQRKEENIEGEVTNDIHHLARFTWSQFYLNRLGGNGSLVKEVMNFISEKQNKKDEPAKPKKSSPKTTKRKKKDEVE